jgi:autotransporter-associated beta strand protein
MHCQTPRARRARAAAPLRGRTSRRTANLVLGLLALAAASAARAQTTTWTGAGSTDWFVSGNWNSGVPTSVGTAILGGAGSNQPMLTNNATVSVLTMNGTGNTLDLNSHTLTASTLNLSVGTITNQQGGSTTLTVDILNMTGGSIDASVGTLVVTGTANLTGVSPGTSIITGSGGVVIQGGTVGLFGRNNYTGGTTLNAGTLLVSSFSSIGTGPITFNGGTLGPGLGSTPSLQNDVILSAGGGTIDAGSQFLSLLGPISGDGGLTKLGSGSLNVSQSIYGGPTLVSQGTLFGIRADALSANSAYTVSAGGRLLLGGDETIGSLAGGGSVTISGGEAVTLTVGGDNSSTTFSGSLEGRGSDLLSLIKTGSGTMILTGTSANLGGLTVNGGTLQLGAGGSLPSTVALTVNTGGTFDLNGNRQTVGAFSGSGAVTLGSGTLTVGDGTNTTFTGVISGAGGNLVKQGSGTLTLGGANTYTGTTTVNAGTLSLNGSLTSDTRVNAGGTLGGTGTVTGTVSVFGTIAPGNSIGTLNVVGAYTQNAGSTYTVEVNNAGQSDRINVTGPAALAGGTVRVQAAPGRYPRSTSYTILSATGGVTGTYAGVTSNFAFLAPSLGYSSNAVALTLLASFQGSWETGNQNAVGGVLDVASPGASGDFATVLNTLFDLDPTQAARALDAIGGQNYSGFASVAVQGTQMFMDSFQVQAGGGGTGQPGRTYAALRTDADRCDTACDVEPLWGAWGGGMGAFGTVAGDANSHGLTYTLGGFIAGLDRRLAPDFRAGVATGFNAASLYTNGMPGYGTSNTLQFALYGEYLAGPLYLDALAGYGRSDNRLSRPIIIPGLPLRTAQGYTTADTFFGQLESGYKIAVAPSFGGFVTPFARLQASTSTQAGLTESGADSLNLTVAQQTTQSLRTVLGAQLGGALDAPWHEKLDLTLRLGWSHEFADLTRPVSASFAGAPTLGFTTFGAVAPRDGAVLGLGGNTAIAERTTAYLRYDGNLAGGNTNHVLSAGVRYVW